MIIFIYIYMQIDIKLEVDINASERLKKFLEELIKRRHDTKNELNKKRRSLEKLTNIIKQMEIDIRVTSRYYHNEFENKRLLTVS